MDSRDDGPEDLESRVPAHSSLQYQNLAPHNSLCYIIHEEEQEHDQEMVRAVPIHGYHNENEDENDHELEQHNDGDVAGEQHQMAQPLGQQNNLRAEQQLELLRDLLRLERANCEQRRHNNRTLQRYIEQLQADYLRQQSDLVQALEFSHKLKDQKDSQLACVEANLSEKEALIEQLRAQLASLDEATLRAELKHALDKQSQLKQVELDQLRQQIGALEQQVECERVKSTQKVEQFESKLEDQLRLHESEIASMKERLGASRDELERVLSEPQNLVIRTLREDKSQLSMRVDELQLALQESQIKYESMRTRLDELQAEQKLLEAKARDELDTAQAAHAELRRAQQELKLELEDKSEVNQILQFNLGRSEKRVKNLLSSLKVKEATYRELMGAHETRHACEVEKLRGEVQSREKRLIECESELNKKQNELVRQQLEQENQLESLRNDRDERLRKGALERTKLEQELRATELRLAREAEQASQVAKRGDQLESELTTMRAESKRLSIELTKCEAKLYARQQEVAQLSARLSVLQGELEQGKEMSAGGDGQQLDALRRELEGERSLSTRLRSSAEEVRNENEKLCVKLKIAETNLDKISATLNREHAKMVLEYEKRLEAIRAQQASFDRNKLRYKRYGYKLKKYCEHLKRVHEHLCTPSSCGFIIADQQQQQQRSTSALSVNACSGTNGGGGGSDGCDDYEDNNEDDEDYGAGLLLNVSHHEVDDAESRIYEEIKEQDGWHHNQDFADDEKAPATTFHHRLLIKRTGGGGSHNTPGNAIVNNNCKQKSCTKKQLKFTEPVVAARHATRQQQQVAGNVPARTPLKIRNTCEISGPASNQHSRPILANASNNNSKTTTATNPLRRSVRSCQPENDDRHAYYYIRDDKRRQTPSPSCISGRSIGAASNISSITTSSTTTTHRSSSTPPSVAFRQTKLSLARTRARQQQQVPLCRAVI